MPTTGGTLILPRSVLFVVKTSNKGTGGLETIATFQRDKGDVPTMIIHNNLLCVITKFQFSLIISRTMTVI